MHLQITGKNFDVGDSFRGYIEDKLKDAVGKHFQHSHDAQVRLHTEGHLYVADITVHIAKGMVLKAEGQADEPYPAFDKAVDKVVRRLDRYKGRLRDAHKRAEPEGMLIGEQVIDAEETSQWEDPKGQPLIIAEMETRVETLTVQEAVMKLDLSDSPAMLFKDRKTDHINMIYRRPDGNISWVDPSNVKAVETV
ncbi:MAG: ribosome-associated translation inhibitor RaiA [Alphaproteobacteria bacterium]